jgi:hypothetical protein
VRARSETFSREGFATPVSSQIAIAAQSFNQNDSFLKKTIDGLSKRTAL